MHIERHQLIPWACLPVLLGFVWLVYHPGLHGDFLFDDFANLPALGSTGPITHWSTFFRYITSSTADPTGRPLTLLSFLLDGHDWPTAAYPFKRTNVLLHLINGTLLAILLVNLGKRIFVTETLRAKNGVVMAGVTAAGLWLMHPLLVSTVLYVVQREAMLPMVFVLIGLLLWLRGRDALMEGRWVAGTVWTVLGLLGCTALATLSKANGILLPMYAVLIEYLLLRKRSPVCTDACIADTKSIPGIWVYRKLFILVAWLPACFVLAYLVYTGITGAIYGVNRPWTIGQRLITEPRVLFDYLDLLWLPHPFTPGLFNDQIMASHSLWSPPSTLLALAGILGLLLAGWRLRRRHPILALAILFYFTGQLLESSSVALELYYEHRNYIPAMMMFWPLSLWLWEVGRNKPSGYSRIKIALVLLLILSLGVMTYARTSLWGNGQQQALLWATLNPASARAQANAADYEMTAGRPLAAEARLQAILREHPDDPQITLNILSAHCQLGGIAQHDLDLAENTLVHMNDKGAKVIFHWLGNAIRLATAHDCPGLTSDSISAMLDAAEQNPRLNRVTGRKQDIYHLRGQLALAEHHPVEALIWFEKGLALRPSPQMAFQQAAMLGSSGYPKKGLDELDFYESAQPPSPPSGLGMPRIHAWVLQHQRYWPKELVYLRTTLSKDAATQERDKK